MTKFVNITNIRTEISSLAQKTKDGDEIVLLKNGKPTMALMSYSDFEEFKVWKNKQSMLKTISKIREEADKLQLGENWLAQNGKKNITDEELLDLISNDSNNS